MRIKLQEERGAMAPDKKKKVAQTYQIDCDLRAREAGEGVEGPDWGGKWQRDNGDADKVVNEDTEPCCSRR